jgi:hypothetical protein
MSADREENFEAWLNKQFDADDPAEDVDEGGAMAGDIVALCEQYGVPIEGAMELMQRQIKILQAIGKVRDMAKSLEDDGIARGGFTDAWQAIVLRHLTQFLQDRP